MDFIIDTVGDNELQVKTETSESEETLFIDKDKTKQSILDLFYKKKQELDIQFASEELLQNKLKVLKINNHFDEFFEEMGWSQHIIVKHEKKKKRLFNFDQLDKETGKLKSNLGGIDIEKEMQNSVLKPGIEKEHSLPKYNISDKTLRILRKKEREKTKGPGWFNMAAPEINDELKNDLQVLKMRSALDPKHFYKKNDMEVLPKYFQKCKAYRSTKQIYRTSETILLMALQMFIDTFVYVVGKIMDSALDHVNERLTRKDRKRTMVDELLADAEFQKYNKKKYKEIIDEKRKTEYKTFMKDKRQKNKAILKKNKLKAKNK